MSAPEIPPTPSRSQRDELNETSLLWKEAEAAVIGGDASTLERLLREHPKLREEEPTGYVPHGPHPDYSEGDVRSIITREHHFGSFGEFTEYLEALRRTDSDISRFESAVNAVVTGDVKTLERLLHDHPDLVHACSSRRHRATLLHYVGANGIEAFRQRTPNNAVKITETLLKSGADVDSVADIYGKSATLGLVASSIHPWLAGVQLELLATLLRAGADIDGAPEERSPLLSALHNGRPEAAEFLASRGARLDLEGAAGVGRLDLVKSFFNPDGSLKEPATAVQLSVGFKWACQYGRTSTVEFLLPKVDAATQNDGLHGAAMSGSVETLKLLLKRKLPLESKNEWGGTVLGAAVWTAEHSDEGTDFSPIIEELIAAGAKVDAEPDLKNHVAAILRRRTRSSS